VPLARSGVEIITARYVQEQYSGHPVEAGPARAAWRAIRFQVWREALRRFIRRLIQNAQMSRPRPPADGNPLHQR
jgi:hypothetical protein